MSKRPNPPWSKAFEQNALKHMFLSYSLLCWYLHMKDETEDRDPKDIWIDVLQTVALGLAKREERTRQQMIDSYVRGVPPTIHDIDNLKSIMEPRVTWGDGSRWIDEETWTMIYRDYQQQFGQVEESPGPPGRPKVNG